MYSNVREQPRENERSVDEMKDGQKKVWFCLLAIVLAAIVIGILSYLSAPREQGGEGFLIRAATVEDAAQPDCVYEGTQYGEKPWEDEQEVCDVF